MLLADTAGLHVLRGCDGTVVAESAAGTCTYAHAYPLVADVDGDDKAEILLGSHACADSTATGLRAVGEAGDGWVRARPLWNQYEYASACGTT